MKCYDELMSLLISSKSQIDSEQFRKVLRYMKSGIESNATLECGGDRLGTRGYFIQPTVFSSVTVKTLISSGINAFIISY